MLKFRSKEQLCQTVMIINRITSPLPAISPLHHLNKTNKIFMTLNPCDGTTNLGTSFYLMSGS